MTRPTLAPEEKKKRVQGCANWGMTRSGGGARSSSRKVAAVIKKEARLREGKEANGLAES